MKSKQKWLISLVAGLLFALLSLPFTYGLTDKVTELAGVHTITHGSSEVTAFGLGLHTVVYILVFRLILVFAAK